MIFWQRKKRKRRQRSKVNELLIDLDLHTGISLYEQIYRYIRKDITGGRLSCGERLPSARLLASQLQVSRSTVDAAYAQLVSEGYLQAKRGSGYYVCDIGALYDLAQPQVQQFSDSLQKTRGTQPKYNFLPGQVDDQGFAYNAWRKCAKEALLALETSHQLLQAGHPQGEYELREAVASYLYQARGVRCQPRQLVIGAGNEYLLQMLGQMFAKGAGKVAMESPTYLQAYHTFQNIGYEVVAVPMDDYGMVADKIPDTDLTFAYVMPSHQFPIGTVMPLKRRLELLAWAKAGEQRYIIEDDHDSEFRYKGRPIPSLQGISQLDRVIYLGTFSNSIMPSIRISYMVLPPQLVDVYARTCGFYAPTVSKIQQMTVCHFIKQGYFERHLNKMRGIYKSKHDLLLYLLKQKEWVYRIYGGHAGLHLAVELDCGLTEEEVSKRAEKYGMCVQGLAECYPAGDGKRGVRPVMLLGFGRLSEKEIRDGVEILERCLQEGGDQAVGLIPQ